MPARDCILAIDQGTTGTTTVIYDFTDRSDPKILGTSTIGFQQHYPREAWVEHRLDEIWASIRESVAATIEKVQAADSSFSTSDISAIGITNQRETLCVFDRQTGAEIIPAIVWQCRRSSDICSRLKQSGLEPELRAKTGLLLDPYFSGTKILWASENHASVKKGIEAGSAALGTIDAWLVYKLTGGERFATEPSNASRTQLFDIHKSAWDDTLLETMGVGNRDVLPDIQDSASGFGETRGLGFLPDGIPITGILGDQQAALAGQACFETGEGKCTYGTGAFLLVHQGARAKISDSGLLTTVAASIDGKLTYAFEGSAFIAGAAVQFVRDQLGFVAHASDSEALARDCKAAPYVYFVPALTGLGAPRWDPDARGAFFGLTRGTTKGQMVRAALEGIAFQVRDLVTEIEGEIGQRVSVLKVDGGASANDLLMSIQSEFTGTVLDRPKNLETTAFGAAVTAGLGAGMFRSLSEVSSARESERRFAPPSDREGKTGRAEALAGWKRACDAVQVFAGTRS